MKNFVLRLEPGTPLVQSRRVNHSSVNFRCFLTHCSVRYSSILKGTLLHRWQQIINLCYGKVRSEKRLNGVHFCHVLCPEIRKKLPCTFSLSGHILM